MIVLKNKILILFAIIIVMIVCSLNGTVAMLCFCILFQVGATLAIIKQIKLSNKIKNGKYVTGNLIEVRKILGSENEVHNYEGTIEFYFPENKNKYLLKHKFSSLVKPNTLKEYKIWVNEENPNDSIVLDFFNQYWKFSIAVFSLIVTGLFVVDYLLLQKLK